MDRSDDEISNDAEKEKWRFIKLIARFEAALEAIDPEVAPMNVIDNINNGMRQSPIWGEVTNWSANGNIAHLANANNQMTAQLTNLSYLESQSRSSASLRIFEDMDREFQNFLERVGRKQSSLIEKSNKLSERLDVMSNSVSQVESDIEVKKIELGQLFSGWQSEFTQAQSERAKSYDEWKAEVSKSFVDRSDKLIDVASQRLKESQDSLTKEMNALLESGNARHQEILDLHEIVAGDSVAAGFLQTATAEANQANIWRIVSIVFVVLTAVWTILAYFTGGVNGPAEPSYWGQAIKALSVAGVLLFGAVYSAKQSNLHRHNEQRSKWLALEVKAIDPYIASLDAAEQKELKKALSEKLFGQANHQMLPAKDAVNGHYVEELMNGIVSVIKAAK